MRDGQRDRRGQRLRPSDLAAELARTDEKLHLMSVRKERRELLTISGNETELLPERA